MGKAPKLSRGDKRIDSKSQKKVVAAEVEEMLRAAPKSRAPAAAAVQPVAVRASALRTGGKTGAARPPKTAKPGLPPAASVIKGAAKLADDTAKETAQRVTAGAKQMAKSIDSAAMENTAVARAIADKAVEQAKSVAQETARSADTAAKESIATARVMTEQAAETMDSVAKESAKTVDEVTKKTAETMQAGAAASATVAATVAKEVDKGMEAAAATVREDASRPVGLSPVLPSAEKAHRSFARSVETWHRSVEAAGRGAVTVNCTLLGLAQETVNSSLELARDLAAARTPIEAARLHLHFWQDWFDACESHNKTLRQVALELTAHVRAPVRGELGS